MHLLWQLMNPINVVAHRARWVETFATEHGRLYVETACRALGRLTRLIMFMGVVLARLVFLYLEATATQTVTAQRYNKQIAKDEGAIDAAVAPPPLPAIRTPPLVFVLVIASELAVHGWREERLLLMRLERFQRDHTELGDRTPLAFHLEHWISLVHTQRLTAPILYGLVLLVAFAPASIIHFSLVSTTFVCAALLLLHQVLVATTTLRHAEAVWQAHAPVD
jgi:hypothetical protein